MRVRALLCVVVIACVAPAFPALAQPTQAEIEASKKVAAEAANKAFDAFKDGKYEEAIAGFQKADKAFHALKFVLYIARAQAKLGKLGAAKTAYESLITEQLATYAPPEFFAAQSDAKKEIVDLLPRIPTLTIQARPGVTGVTLDGQPAAIGQPLSLDPGDHLIVATGPDQRPISKKITLQERDAKTETLEPPAVAPPPVVTATASASGKQAPSATLSPSSTTSAAVPSTGSFLSSMPLVTKVTYGVGAAGLVLGAVFGGLTLAKRGDYDALRAGGAGDAHAVNEAALQGRTFGLVTDIGFLVGIAGVATGTIVWIVSPARPAPGPRGVDVAGAKASSSGKKTDRILSVSPQPNGLSISGTF